MLRNSYADNIFKRRSLFAKQNVFMLVGAEPHNFGLVMSCSMNADKVFGTSTRNIIGKNINTLMTKSIRGLHDGLLKKKLKDSEKVFEFSQFEVCGVNHDGYVIPLQTTVTLYPSISEGLLFWGMMRPITSYPEFIIFDDLGNIEGATEMISKELNLNCAEEISITNICHAKKIIRMLTECSLKEKPPNEKEVFYTIFTRRGENYVKSRVSYEDKCTLREKTYNNKTLKIIEVKKFYKTNESGDDLPQDVDELLDELNFNDNIEQATSTPQLPLSQESITHQTQLLPKTWTHISTATKVNKTLKSDHPQAIPLSKEKEAEEEEDTENSSEGSDQEIDERVSVGMSMSSTKMEKEVEVNLSGIVKSLPFYKFRSAHIPSFCLLIFMIAFLVSILIVNISTTKSITSIQDRVSILDLIYARSKLIANMGRDMNFIFNWNYQIFDPMNPVALIFIFDLYVQALNITAPNSELQRLASKLDHETKQKFFQRDIRIFYSDYSNIPNGNDYELMDSFDAVNNIVSRIFFLFMQYANEGPRKYDTVEFLYGNLNNDLWIKSLYLPTIIVKDIKAKVDSILEINDLAFTISASLLGVFALSLAIFIAKSFIDTRAFLRLIINYSSSGLIDYALINIDFFRGFIRKKFQGKDATIPSKSERKKATEDRFRWKRGDDSALFASFLKKLLIMLSFLAVPFMLMWESYVTIHRNAEEVMPTINDVVNINNIIIHGVQTYVETSNYLYRNDSVRYMNQYARDRLDADIEAISETISEEKGFTARTQKFLHSSICEYYLFIEGLPACTDLLKGVGLRGIIPSMIAYKGVVRSIKARIDNAESILDLFMIFGDIDFFESYFLLMMGIAISVEVFEKELVNGLIQKLDKATNHTIILFILGLVFGIIMCTAIGGIIYRYLWKDRRKTSGTLQILPLELIMTNKHLKNYLLKEAPKFYKFVKKYEVIKKKEELLEDKIIKATQGTKKA